MIFGSAAASTVGKHHACTSLRMTVHANAMLRYHVFLLSIRTFFCAIRMGGSRARWYRLQ